MCVHTSLSLLSIITLTRDKGDSKTLSSYFLLSPTYESGVFVLKPIKKKLFILLIL